MVFNEAKISIAGFSVGLIIQTLSWSQAGDYLMLLVKEPFNCVYFQVAIFFVINLLMIRLIFRRDSFPIAIRAGFLGYMTSISIAILLCAGNRFKSFGIYGIFMSLFHYTEYLTIAFTHPKSLSLDSFMLCHSVQYVTAAIVSWIEFFVETTYFPEMKNIKTLWIIGSSICLCGEILRKTAMIQAQKSFHHIVQFQRDDEHKLVTSGIYGFMRHPSYVGWFYWSIGTQIILANPVCFVIYIIASWLFFNERIYMEEIALLNFFGQDYLKYQKEVNTGLPFIKGYTLDID